MNATQRKLVTSGYLSVKEAAKFLGLGLTQTYALLHAGVLSHAQHGGKYVVPRAALESYAAQRLVVGTVA
ncbi:MAG TPA: helix-turn-helix domain-containing protein [Candidatus Baltobacteraceae bacterium]|jgi:excisionase family DNA binding protein|nr:helix-turn-helix domain-containing protein [Candidatus Baltobacteraceae bacterium]